MKNTNFEKSQQDLIETFKEKLQEVAKDVINDFYSNVTPYAETDAHINFVQALRADIYNELVNEIKSQHTHYSWASSIRMALLRDHKELQNKIIEDLQGKIKTLEAHLESAQRRF